jgi:hypothetical protein
LELLRALFASDAPSFVQHEDPPQEYEVPGSWHPQGDKTWAVPSGLELDDRAFLSWLSLGCWVAYSASRPVLTWLDVFHVSPEEVMQWIRARGVLAAISSFHDDDEWRVIVCSS